MEQPEPLKFVPVRKSEQELSKERQEELKRQVEFLAKDPGAVEWGKKFPEKLEADLKRIKAELKPEPKKAEPPKEEPKVAKKVEKKSK